MADCITPAQVSDIAVKDVTRLQGVVAKTLAANAVFINLLEGGILPSGESDVVRSAVQMPACPGDSLAIPTFENDTAMCGIQGLQDLTGTIEYTYRLQTKRGFGPRICVKNGYAAFKTSYSSAEDALAKLVTQYINADVRAQLYLKSASKFVAAAGYCFEDLFTGGEFNNVGTLFANVLPTGPLSFKALHYVARYLKEVLWADMWPADGKVQEHFRFIGGADQIELFRAELSNGCGSPLTALTEGGFRLGETSIAGYSFEGSSAFRGIAFGVDQTPLRATGFDEDGLLALVNPRTCVTATGNTAYSKTNPDWVSAPYEVGFLVAPMSFKRLVPERYVGEGSFRFAPQLAMGSLEWHYEIDNDCNVFGDFGWHKYQITRAYQPVRPHHIIPILYRRCLADLGLEDCAVSTCQSVEVIT